LLDSVAVTVRAVLAITPVVATAEPLSDAGSTVTGEATVAELVLSPSTSLSSALAKVIVRLA
jgi:hypothetical protein